MEANESTNQEKLDFLEEKRIQLEKYKFNVEVFKWFMGSVVIVIITLVVESGFRERATGLIEMEAFDKYVNVILEENSIEKRWKLTEYFATVTPTERLQNKWKNYRDSIREEYNQFIQLNRQKIIVESKITQIQQNLIVQDSSLSVQPNESLDKLNSALDDIQFKLDKIDYQVQEQSPSNDAEFLESEGFRSLINYDVNSAISNFKNSEKTMNGFHQVYEIANYLEKNKIELENPNSEFWPIAFREIANSYSWKMDESIKNQLILLSNDR